MDRVINFSSDFYEISINVESIAYQLTIVFLVMIMIVSLSALILIFQYRRLSPLFKQEKYDLCRKKIAFLYKFHPYKINREWLELISAQILVTEDKLVEAEKKLETLAMERWLKLKYFWLCVIYLKKEDNKRLIAYFEKFKLLTKTQDIDFKYLENLVLKKTNQKEKMDKSLLQKLKCKYLIDFYQKELENQTKE